MAEDSDPGAPQGDRGLIPPFVQSNTLRWEHARWVGELDDNDPRLVDRERLMLQGGDGFRLARLLVRHGDAPRGFVDVPVTDGAIECAVLTTRIAELPEADEPATRDTSQPPAITVALCTRDRGEQLAVALRSLLALEYPSFEILIIDNASATESAAEIVARFDDPRVRISYEPRPGLSCARNRALVEARTGWVAFTDDDVVVDPGWVRGLAAAINSDSRPGLVCGMVATGELASDAQLYFERRIAWVGAMRSAVFGMSDPPPDVPLFPFEVGLYGTGANFAVERKLAIVLGGFNEALGAGTPTGGGEDIDMFVRVIVSGRTLMRESRALVWHRHRHTPEEIQSQMRSYGLGMAAWMTSVLGEPSTRRLALSRIGRVVGRLGQFGALATDGAELSPVSSDAVGVPATPDEAFTARLRRLEVQGLLGGPGAYLRARASGRAPRPLRWART